MKENHTRSGIPLKPFYTPEDLNGRDYEKQLGPPGEFSYTRGRRADPAGGWMHRELSGEGDPARSNEQLKYLLSQGQIGLDVIGDSPTMAFMDPDHPLAANAIGTQGVSLCCLDDFRVLYKDLPLNSVVVSASLPPAITVAALYLVARENNVPQDQLRGSVIQAPFCAEDCGYAGHMPFRLRLRLAADCIEFCSKVMPRFHSFVEDTYFFNQAGLKAVDEMALGFIEIRQRIDEIEALGDPAELSDKGWFRKSFEDTMAEYSRKIADGSMPKVGLNIFRIPEEEDTLLKEIVEGKIEVWWDRIDKIQDYKKRRDQAKIREILAKVLDAAKDERNNLITPTIDAFEAGATMGEIGGVMRMAYNWPYDPHGLLESPL